VYVKTIVRNDREAVNTLVAIPLDGGTAQVLVSGNDFIPRRGLVRMVRSWRGSPGITPTCPGIAASFDRRNTRRTIAIRKLVAGGPRESIFSRSGRPTERSISFPIARAGGTSIARRQSSHRRCLRMQAEFARRNGYSDYRIRI